MDDKLYTLIYKKTMNEDLYKNHFHEFCEIIFCYTENMSFFVNDKIYVLNKGDILLINGKDIHRPIIPKDVYYERSYLIFDQRKIYEYSTINTDLLLCFKSSRNNHKLSLSKEDALILENLHKECEKYNNNDTTYGDDILKKISLIKLLLFINKKYTTDYETFDMVENRIKNIQMYIANNPSKNLSLESLSQKFFISKRYLEFLFKKNCGFTVGEYITTIRIIKSKELLKSGINVSEVGEMVGYYNPSHFSRVFKNKTGFSPKKYSQS